MIRSIRMIPAEFGIGDKVVLAEGPYQGTVGVFRSLTPDVNWAEIEEPEHRVRTHPVRWLRHAARPATIVVG